MHPNTPGSPPLPAHSEAAFSSERGRPHPAIRPDDRRLRANRSPRSREEQALAGQLGYRYSRLPVMLRALVDAAATTIRQIDATRAAQLAGARVSDEDVVRLGRLLNSFLAELELDRAGQAARRERERQAAIEAEQRRKGINLKRPGER